MNNQALRNHKRDGSKRGDRVNRAVRKDGSPVPPAIDSTLHFAWRSSVEQFGPTPIDKRRRLNSRPTIGPRTAFGADPALRRLILRPSPSTICRLERSRAVNVSENWLPVWTDQPEGRLRAAEGQLSCAGHGANSPRITPIVGRDQSKCAGALLDHRVRTQRGGVYELHGTAAADRGLNRDGRRVRTQVSRPQQQRPAVVQAGSVWRGLLREPGVPASGHDRKH